jgi:hypothetical protein
MTVVHDQTALEAMSVVKVAPVSQICMADRRRGTVRQHHGVETP